MCSGRTQLQIAWKHTSVYIPTRDRTGEKLVEVGADVLKCGTRYSDHFKNTPALLFLQKPYPGNGR